jgi:hypothetical protein
MAGPVLLMIRQLFAVSTQDNFDRKRHQTRQPSLVIAQSGLRRAPLAIGHARPFGRAPTSGLPPQTDIIDIRLNVSTAEGRYSEDVGR